MGNVIKLVIAVVALSFQLSFAVTTEKEWHELTDKALDLFYYGKKVEAVNVARQALKAAEELFGPDNVKVAGAVDNLATYVAATGDAAEAEKLYQRALSMLERKLPPDDPYLAIFMDYLALYYDKIGKKEYAAELRKKAKAIRKINAAKETE